MMWSCSMRLNTAKIMNKVWTKELLFDILMMFNTIWQERHEQQVQRKQRFDEPLRLPRPVLPSPDAVSDPRKNTRFCVNPTRFSLFLSGEEGGGRRFFVNEGEHAGGRETACGLAAGVAFGLQYAEWQRITWWLRAVDGC